MKPQNDKTPPLPSNPAGNPRGEPIRRIGLVSHNAWLQDKAGRWDYSEHFQAINRLCDAQGCDTILYALWTWDTSTRRGSKRPESPLDGLQHVQRIFIEAGDLSDGNHPSGLTQVVWERGSGTPREFTQVFSSSNESAALGPRLMEELPARQVANGLLMVCGESNLVSWRMVEARMADPFGIRTWLDGRGTDVILNPVHDYMAWKMWRKRKYLSEGRWMVSVWNQGKGVDSPAGPWMACHKGSIRTERVKEIPRPFLDRPDIRIGILSLDGKG